VIKYKTIPGVLIKKLKRCKALGFNYGMIAINSGIGKNVLSTWLCGSVGSASPQSLARVRTVVDMLIDGNSVHGEGESDKPTQPELPLNGERNYLPLAFRCSLCSVTLKGKCVDSGILVDPCSCTQVKLDEAKSAISKLNKELN